MARGFIPQCSVCGRGECGPDLKGLKERTRAAEYLPKRSYFSVYRRGYFLLFSFRLRGFLNFRCLVEGIVLSFWLRESVLSFQFLVEGNAV